MFEDKHYVPILKTKTGEGWSLLHLSDACRPTITPLFEVHPPKKKKGEAPKPLDLHIHEICQMIHRSWRTTCRFFIDTEWINQKHGTDASLTAVLDECRTRELKAIPVVKIDYDQAALSAVKAAIQQDQQGCMLRLDFEDVGVHAAIKGVLDELKLSAAEIHLLLDYRERRMNLAEDVPKLPFVSEWLTFSASSAAFPKTISTLEQRTWIDLPRFDWESWQESRKTDSLERRPTYSDYATRCFGPPAGGGDPIVHLRYATEDKWLVYCDGTLQSGDADKMPSICLALTRRPEFNGRNFCDGDKEINRIGNQWGDTDTGGPVQWLQWCLNHHLTLVARQLQTGSAA